MLELGSMNRTAPAAAATLSFLVLVSTRARAAEVVATGLSYDADASCPDARTFARMVGERAPSIDLTIVEADRADVVVVLREGPDSYRGMLRIRRGDGNDYVRDMRGATCAELGSALAFVAALALRGGEEPPPIAGPRREELRANEPFVPPDEVRTPSPPTPAAGWTWGAAAGLGIRFGLAPTWANTEELDLEAGPSSDAIVAPLVRLGVVHAEPVTRIDRFGTTTFTWIALRAAGCPIQLRWMGRFELRPCGGIGWGILGASGVPSALGGTAKDESPTWVDVFGTLRLGARLVGPLYAVAEAELVVPLTRYEIGFDPGVRVYAVPMAAGAGFAGLAGHFP
jgi:hypothetical protein